jgi:hypothetical protein
LESARKACAGIIASFVKKVVNVTTGKSDTKVCGEKTRRKELTRFRSAFGALACFRRLFLFEFTERRDEETRSGEAANDGRRWFASSRRRLFWGERSRLKPTRRGGTVGVFAGGDFVGRSKRRRASVFLRALFAVVLRRTSTKRFNGLAELPYEQVGKEGARRRAASRGNA